MDNKAQKFLIGLIMAISFLSVFICSFNKKCDHVYVRVEAFGGIKQICDPKFYQSFVCVKCYDVINNPFCETK